MLITRATQGDVGAYETLVGLYQDLAFRTAYVITGDRANAQDVAQEAFLRAYRAMPRFGPGNPFRPWILRIVANEARRHLGAGEAPTTTQEVSSSAADQQDAVRPFRPSSPVDTRTLLPQVDEPDAPCSPIQ